MIVGTDRVLEAYKTVLTDLEQRRAALDKQIEAVKLAMNAAGAGTELLSTFTASPAANGSEPPKIETDTFVGMSVSKSARTYLKMTGKKQHIRDIVAAINQGRAGMKTSVAVASKLLRRRAVAKGDVVSLGRGEWGLLEWYPDLKRKRTKKQTAAAEAEEAPDELEPKLGEMPAEATPTSIDDEDVPF